MKQYVVDQLRGSDHALILDYLSRNAEETTFGDLFWVPLPERLYSKIQEEHVQCAPYYFAVNLLDTRVDFEFLIRSRQNIRCGCIAYATPDQRDYIMAYADEMLERLKIVV